MPALSRREFVQTGALAGLALTSSGAGADSEAPAEETASPWLVMLYLAGDNSLTEDMVLALQDLQAEGPPRGDKIVAQFDPSGIGLSAQRYDFSDVAPGKALDDYRDRTFEPSEVDTGSRQALVDFVKWADAKCWNVQKTKKNAYQYLLILSGHGSGTTEDFLLKDESPTDSLTIDELKAALVAANERIGSGLAQPNKKIDILGLDACYMCMGEIAYQIRDQVGILIGAEGLEPEFGWPYRRLLRKVKETRQQKQGQAMAPDTLAKTIVTEYVGHYSDYDRSAGRSADLAAMNLSEIPGVEGSLKGLVTALEGLDKAGHEKVLLAHWYAQTYKDDQFVDLKDLCDQMTGQFGETGLIGKACSKVVSSLQRCVLSPAAAGLPVSTRTVSRSTSLGPSCRPTT